MIATAPEWLPPILVFAGSRPGQAIMNDIVGLGDELTGTPGTSWEFNLDQPMTTAYRTVETANDFLEWYDSLDPLDLPPPNNHADDNAKYPVTPVPNNSNADEDRPPQPQPGPPPAPSFSGVASNGFTGSVVGYDAFGPSEGSITGSLLGDLKANSPSYNDALRKLKKKKGH